MEHFSLGIMTILGAVLFPALWYIGFKLRTLQAWATGGDRPKDKVLFFLVVATIFGLLIGSFAQPFWNKASECKMSGLPVFSCTFIPK